MGKEEARPALSLVGYDDEVKAAMEYVFGTSFVCGSMENAKKVHLYLCSCTCTVQCVSYVLCLYLFNVNGTIVFATIYIILQHMEPPF